MPPNGKQSIKKQDMSQLPPIPEKKSRTFWAVIVVVIFGLVGAGLYFSGRIFQSPPLETAGIYSASGKIISLSPENNSFILEIEVPLRYQHDETTYVTQQKTVIVGDETSLFDGFGSVTSDVFFLNANEGDVVYVSSDNFLNDASFSPDVVILHADRMNPEAGGLAEGEEAEILGDLERSNFYEE